MMKVFIVSYVLRISEFDWCNKGDIKLIRFWNQKYFFNIFKLHLVLNYFELLHVIIFIEPSTIIWTGHVAHAQIIFFLLMIIIGHYNNGFYQNKRLPHFIRKVVLAHLAPSQMLSFKHFFTHPGQTFMNI